MADKKDKKTEQQKLGDKVDKVWKWLNNFGVDFEGLRQRVTGLGTQTVPAPAASAAKQNYTPFIIAGVVFFVIYASGKK